VPPKEKEKEKHRDTDREMGNPKQKWTAEEEEALRAGVAKHGTGKWKDIQRDPQFNVHLASRSNIDLKVTLSLSPSLYICVYMFFCMWVLMNKQKRTRIFSSCNQRTCLYDLYAIGVTVILDF
jgi:hypothetical protein